MLGVKAEDIPNFLNGHGPLMYFDEKPKDRIWISTVTGPMGSEQFAAENGKIAAMKGLVSGTTDKNIPEVVNWEFEVPEEWLHDFKAITSMEILHTSTKYRKMLAAMYPETAELFPALAAAATAEASVGTPEDVVMDNAMHRLLELHQRLAKARPISNDIVEIGLRQAKVVMHDQITRTMSQSKGAVIADVKVISVDSIEELADLFAPGKPCPGCGKIHGPGGHQDDLILPS
jgi:hypothetical protein